MLPENSTSWSSLQISHRKKQSVRGDTTTSPRQPGSPYSPVDRTNPTKDDSVLVPAQRRRAQNRASQRAFRERKERHVKNLEEQLEELHQQYEELRRVYEQQKEDISNLKEELHGFRSRSDAFQVSQNSPLDFPSTTRAQSFQSGICTSQLPHADMLIPPPHSMTSSSTFTKPDVRVRASSSEEHTPFGSLLPLTPAENFESLAMFRPLDPFAASKGVPKNYDGGGFPEVSQQDDFGSPGFSEEFAINPTPDIFEGWR